MKCPICKENVNELDDICPNCKTNFDEYEKNKTSNNASYEDKTLAIRFINALQLIGLIIAGIVSLVGEKIGQGFICILIGIINYFFIRGFADIIDLLDSINDKLDK